jgi:hypothetical protein
MFNGYYYDYQIAAFAQNQALIHTDGATSSAKDGSRSIAHEEELQKALNSDDAEMGNHPLVLLQQFNHDISLQQQQQMESSASLQVLEKPSKKDGKRSQQADQISYLKQQ